MKKAFRIVLASVLLIAMTMTPVFATGAKETMSKEESEALLEKINENSSSAERTVFGTVDKSDMTSSFSYSYGYLITLSLLNQGISLNGAYWLRGINDVLNGSVAPLISTEYMSSIVDEYVTDFYQAGKTEGPGAMPTVEELNALASPEILIDKFSYSYGVMYAIQLYYYNALDIVAPEFMEGAADALWENPNPAMTVDEMNEAVNTYADYLEEEYTQYIEELKTVNLQNAEEFLSLNKEKEGVVVLPSGNQLLFVTEGEEGAAVPTESDSVIVDYELFLLDGTQCDSGSDVTFSLSSLIPGFVEACTNMKVGDEAIAYIHPDYGYGENGNSSIEPNALLIFRITLKGIAE